MIGDIAYDIGYVLGAITTAVFLIAVPVLFVVCLIKTIKTRSKGWLIGTIVSGIPIVAFCALIAVSAISGVCKGFKSRGLGFSRDLADAKATEVHGSKYDYTVSLPEEGHWTVQTGIKHFDKLFDYNDKLYFGVVVELVGAGTPQALEVFVRKNMKEIGKPCTFSETQEQTLDGKSWVTFDTNAVVNEVALKYRHYVYADDDYGLQLVFWTTPKLFPVAQPVFEKIAASFRLPATLPTFPTIDKDFSQIAGNAMLYTLSLPLSRRSYKDKGSPFDLFFDCEGVFVAVVTESEGFQNTDNYEKEVRSRVQKGNPGAKFTESQPISIAGAPWESFEMETTQDLTLRYRYYLYSDAARSLQLVFWSSPKKLARASNMIEKIVASFRFPAKQ